MNCKQCGNLIEDKILIDEEFIKTSKTRIKCYSCSPYIQKSKINKSDRLNKKRLNSRNKRLEFKIKIVKLKGGKCSICNYNKNIAALQLHHIDPTIKDFQLSEAMHKSDYEIVEELKKCVLLCSNCHIEQHNPNHENWQDISISPFSTKKLQLDPIFTG